MFLSRKIGSRKERKWFVVLATSISVFFGLEAVAFLAGIFQLATFLRVALIVYFFMILVASLIFDVKLKIPRSWSRSAYYYQHTKQRVKKFFYILWRAFVMRFHYLRSWSHWLHFQNYLILPAILYWGVVLLIFLNPFDHLRKQIFIICGTLMLAMVFWFFKTVFTSYSSTILEVRYLMFAVMVISGFMVYTAVLGISWYLGLKDGVFLIMVAVLTFLLLYQSLFHHSLLDLRANLRYALFGALFMLLPAYLVTKYWSVNYYTAGVLLAGCLHWYWSNVLQWLQKRLTWRRALEYTALFLFIVLFALATTNFHARIG